MNFKDEKAYSKYIKKNLDTLREMLKEPEKADLSEIMSLFEYLDNYLFRPGYGFSFDQMGAFAIELNQLHYKFIRYLLKDADYMIDDEFMYRQYKEIFKEELNV